LTVENVKCSGNFLHLRKSVQSVADVNVSSIAILFFAVAQLTLANSFHDDSHYVRLGQRTGYYVLREGSPLAHQLGLDDAPFINTSDRLRHGHGADVLAFRFDRIGRLSAPPAYIANAQLSDFYIRRIGSLIRGRATVRDVEALFGHPQTVSRRADGVVNYYTLEVFNPFEESSSDRR
jgi:hypothetical protein